MSKTPEQSKALIAPSRRVPKCVIVGLGVTAILSCTAVGVAISKYYLQVPKNVPTLVMEDQIDVCELSMNLSCVSASSPHAIAPLVQSSPPSSMALQSSPPPPSPSLSPAATPILAPTCITVDDDDGLPTFETNALRAVPGVKPYFDSWHGATSSKSFVHDAHMDKGHRHATYRPHLPEAGCYAVQEWHESGGVYCMNYMPFSVPLTVQHAGGRSLLYIDQHVDGGQWNSMGAFRFGAGASAVLTLANNGTTECVYGAMGVCYWTADALRFVRVEDAVCGAAGFGSRAAVPSEATLEATCDAAEPVAIPAIAVAPQHPPGHSSTFHHAPTGRTLDVTLPAAQPTSAPYASGGALLLSYTATGFSSHTRLVAHLVHGEQILYHLGTVACGADGHTKSLRLTLPDLHQLIEHCSSCRRPSAGFEVRLTEETAHGSAPAATVHTALFQMHWAQYRH